MMPDAADTKSNWQNDILMQALPDENFKCYNHVDHDGFVYSAGMGTGIR